MNDGSVKRFFFGTMSRREPVDDVAAMRERTRVARVANARKQDGWEEIAPAERLCARGPARFGFLVDSDSDRVFTIARGTYFDKASIVADRVEATFYVNADGWPVVLEPVTAIPTWSTYIDRQTRRRHKATAS